MQKIESFSTFTASHSRIFNRMRSGTGSHLDKNACQLLCRDPPIPSFNSLLQLILRLAKHFINLQIKHVALSWYIYDENLEKRTIFHQKIAVEKRCIEKKNLFTTMPVDT